MAHLGEQAVTGERQHDHEQRLDDKGDAARLSDVDLARELNSLVERLFVERHWNAKIIREAALRLGSK